MELFPLFQLPGCRPCHRNSTVLGDPESSQLENTSTAAAPGFAYVSIGFIHMTKMGRQQRLN